MVTTRRAFLQIAAATAAPLAMPAVARAGSPAAARQLVVYEATRAPPAFVRRLRSRGVPARAIHDGDVTDAWLGAVRPAWQRGGASIAGLTTPAALFCLEELALAQGLRVVFHAEHLLLADGRVEHAVQRAPQPRAAGTLQRAGARWPQRLADALLDSPADPARRPGRSLSALEPALPAGATVLTSWIIA